MTCDLLATLSRSTPWPAGARLSGFTRLSTNHTRRSPSQCSVLHIWNQTVFQLCSYHCLVWVEWFTSEINQCSFVLFLALPFQTRSSFSWPCPCVSPSSVVFFHCVSSLTSMLTCAYSDRFFMLFFHFRMHCGMRPLPIPTPKSYCNLKHPHNESCLFPNFLNWVYF